MKLQAQVCNLDLARKLKKLGVKQEGLFYWVRKWDGETGAWDVFNKDDIALDVVDDHASAFTVAELGEMLPIRINAKVKHHGISSELLQIQKGHFGDTPEVQWQVIYYDVQFKNAPTEADARARMLIYLLEKKLVAF